MRDADVTDVELARAKDQIIKSFPARFATRASTAGLMAELAIYGLPDRYLNDYTKNLQAVSKADILRVGEKYLRTQQMTVVVVGDRASQEPALTKLAPVELRDLDGNPVPAAGATSAAVPAPTKDGAGSSE